MSFLFGGQQQQQTTQQQQSTSNVNYPSWYTDYAQNILSKAGQAAETPFPKYDISQMFEPFSADQLQAFQQIRNNQNAYMPYINQAAGALAGVSGYDPYKSGMPYIDRAGAGPTAYQAGAPGVQAGMQTWPGAMQQQYMDPYLTGAIGYAQQLAGNQFREKTLPDVNKAFMGAQAGGKRYADYMGRATRDFENVQAGTAQTMANQGYWNAANQFNTDMSRMITGGGALGGLANQTAQTLGNLGQQAAGITSGAVQTGTGLAGAYSNLGSALSNLNLTNTNALLQAGQMQQQQGQLPRTAAYNQFQAEAQWPFQMVNFMNAAQRGLQIPTTTTSNISQTAGQSGTKQGSLLGDILGTAQAGLGLYGQASKIFGGSSNTGAQGTVGADPSGYNPQLPAGPDNIPQEARGGYIKGFKRGGVLRKADGGGLGSMGGGLLSLLGIGGDGGGGDLASSPLAGPGLQLIAGKDPTDSPFASPILRLIGGHSPFGFDDGGVVPSATPDPNATNFGGGLGFGSGPVALPGAAQAQPPPQSTQAGAMGALGGGGWGRRGFGGGFGGGWGGRGFGGGALGGGGGMDAGISRAMANWGGANVPGYAGIGGSQTSGGFGNDYGAGVNATASSMITPEMMAQYRNSPLTRLRAMPTSPGGWGGGQQGTQFDAMGMGRLARGGYLGRRNYAQGGPAFGPIVEPRMRAGGIPPIIKGINSAPRRGRGALSSGPPGAATPAMPPALGAVAPPALGPAGAAMSPASLPRMRRGGILRAA